MTNILLTGASGCLGTLARKLYSQHSITLLSRSPIATSANESWQESADLRNYHWWESINFGNQYDLVLHFAEPVKEKMSDIDISNTVRSHIGFISSISNVSNRIVYPLTAYRYDPTPPKSARPYLEVKERVYAELKGNERILFPIFHPLVNYGGGLARLIRLENKLPFLNLFNSFEATLPILTKQEIAEYLTSGLFNHEGSIDVYSKIVTIAELFSNPARHDFKMASRIFRGLIGLISFMPPFSLLSFGRNLGFQR